MHSDVINMLTVVSLSVIAICCAVCTRQHLSVGLAAACVACLSVGLAAVCVACLPVGFAAVCVACLSVGLDAREVRDFP